VKPIIWFSLLCSVGLTSLTRADEIPEFHVPGHESEMKSLGQLFQLHLPGAFTNCALWDAWLPQSTVWTGTGKRNQYRQSLFSRRIDEEGYVAVQQHRGMAHSDGWPFPGWPQSTGRGFHFSLDGDGWAIQNFKLQPLKNVDGWEIEGAKVLGFDSGRGLQLQATADILSITTPKFRCGTVVAPFARIEWAVQGLHADSKPKIHWLLEDETEWKPDRFAHVARPSDSNNMQYANVPLYRQPGYAGMLNRYRMVINHAAGSTIDLKSIITAIDTRHPTTNWNFLQACGAYFTWSGDLDFLKLNIDRMRVAARYGIEEFSVDKEKHVVVPWVGHQGRTGLSRDENGKKKLLPGVGVGNNYWDLLPFGGHDAIATMLAYDALMQFSRLEAAIESNSNWLVAAPDSRFSSSKLSQLASEVRQDFQQRFWSPANGRFVGWVDMDGKSYDYGFSFVNLEAIYYGLASDEQARTIFQWLNGQRQVDGDTSSGEDIYRWRFAPRATTRRNVETYCWVWSGPESIAWGDQVQDGGAVLGFSYHDLMARIKTLGPDDAWRRLQAIIQWFDEVQAEGGYRAYYAKLGRGLLQGGGPPGGLGLDHEFLESVLVPQVMLYGFLGFQPTASGIELNPKLPSDWPSLTIKGINIHGFIVNVTAQQNGTVVIQPIQDGPKPITVRYREQQVMLDPGKTLELNTVR
jgi:hypothetical protein